jgi:mycoredoxin
MHESARSPRYAWQSESGDKMAEPVLVYSAPWCPDCWRVKSFLKHRGVEFQEVNIEEDRGAEEVVIRANRGKRRLPTLKVGDRYFACSPFDPLQLAEELHIPLNK